MNANKVVNGLTYHKASMRVERALKRVENAAIRLTASRAWCVGTDVEQSLDDAVCELVAARKAFRKMTPTWMAKRDGRGLQKT